MGQPQNKSVEAHLGSIDDAGWGPVACIRYDFGGSEQAVYGLYREQLSVRGWTESSFYGEPVFQKNRKFLMISYNKEEKFVEICSPTFPPSGLNQP